MAPFTRDQLNQQLREIEARVPVLLADRNRFARAFEDEVERLLSYTATRDQDYAWDQLEAIVERSGFNG